MLRRVLLAGLTAWCLPAHANDSVAELGAGGLVLGRTDAVTMEKEDLFISADQVRVEYVFRNTTEEDVRSIVAFPMPDIAGSPYEMPQVPEAEADNFLGFEVTVDGAPVQPALEQRAFAAGVDVTEELKGRGVPLQPFREKAAAALAGLPQDVADDWLARGVIVIDSYDDGAGMKNVRTPFWELKSTYWWMASFPKGREVRVSHRYTPSVGGSVGLNFYFDGKFDGEYDDYKDRYCMDAAFERAVKNAMKAAGEDSIGLSEERIDYVLTTGGNWATGAIGDFRLVIDKGDPKNLVSFCGEGVKKIGPTTFEMKATDFYPEKDIEILILKPAEN